MTNPTWATITNTPHMPDAACKGRPAHWWDIERNETGRHRRDPITVQNQWALQLCADCPVRQQCHQLPGMVREDVILGGVAYGSLTRTGQPRPIATAEQVAA